MRVRAIMERTARREREQGALHPLRVTLLSLAAALIATGRLADAEACYDESTELTLATGGDPWVPRHMNVELLAWQGKSDEARATARAAIEVAAAGGYPQFEFNAMRAICALELSASNYPAVRRGGPGQLRG